MHPVHGRTAEKSWGAAGEKLLRPQVPKMLGLLRSCWAPAAFVVSFKLETDPTLLLLKVRCWLACSA
jgi:hypothetical protein